MIKLFLKRDKIIDYDGFLLITDSNKFFSKAIKLN